MRRLFWWLMGLHFGIALGYLGLLIKAAVDGLLWRADFTAFYTGGAIVRQGLGPHLYDLALQTRIQQAILGPGRMFYDGVLPFLNPPHFALVMAPFSLLPLGPAFWCWIALQVGILVRVVQRFHLLSADWEQTERWMLLSAFFAFFPLFLQFVHGSLSLFVLWCLTEFYLALREGKDVRAGVWLALAAVKPQAVLFPALVLLAGRRWRALGSASATGLVILGGTVAALGPAIWSDYLQWLAATSGYLDRFGVYPEVMYNLKGMLTLWWGAERASLIQAVSMGALAVGAAGVLALWVRARWAPQHSGFDLRLAFTLTLGALLSPHQNQQDCLILVLPIALFYDSLRRIGHLTRPLTAFLLSWPVLFFLEPFAIRGRLGIRLPVVLMVVLLTWIGV
ncbi:MAG: glycosyltransferase family 87 protein, partial [Anaerolineae bacterium]